MVRLFQPSDMNQVLSLAREQIREAGIESVLPVDDVYFTKTVKNVLIKPTHKLFVVEEGSTLVGYALIGVTTKVWNPTAYSIIHYFFVHPSVRNPYKADALFQACAQFSKEQGCKFMEIGVSLFNQDFTVAESYVDRASKFYEHKQCNYTGDNFVYNLEDGKWAA